MAALINVKWKEIKYIGCWANKFWNTCFSGVRGWIHVENMGCKWVTHDHDHLVTKVRCKDLPDSDQSNFTFWPAIIVYLADKIFQQYVINLWYVTEINLWNICIKQQLVDYAESCNTLRYVHLSLDIFNSAADIISTAYLMLSHPPFVIWCLSTFFFKLNKLP